MHITASSDKEVYTLHVVIDNQWPIYVVWLLKNDEPAKENHQFRFQQIFAAVPAKALQQVHKVMDSESAETSTNTRQQYLFDLKDVWGW